MPNCRRHGAMIRTSVRMSRARRPARPWRRRRPARPRRNRCPRRPRREPSANSSVARSRSSPRSSACAPISRRYGPSRRISSAWLPLSTTRPWSSTRMRSAPITLDSRCARISVVRPCASRSSACWITASFSASTEDSASSRIRIGESRSSARAIARRWRCPPDRLTPRSPMTRLVALRQLQDEFVRVGVARRLFEIGLGRVGLAETQIFLDRAVKQVRVLVHDRDLAAQHVRVQSPADHGRRP